MEINNNIPHKEKRVIVCAAVKLDDNIFCSVRHLDELMIKNIKLSNIDLKDIKSRGVEVQGFMDNRYNFLTRNEAFKVAKKSGQIQSNRDEWYLCSEDLY